MPHNAYRRGLVGIIYLLTFSYLTVATSQPANKGPVIGDYSVPKLIGWRQGALPFMPSYSSGIKYSRTVNGRTVSIAFTCFRPAPGTRSPQLRDLHMGQRNMVAAVRSFNRAKEYGLPSSIIYNGQTRVGTRPAYLSVIRFYHPAQTQEQRELFWINNGNRYYLQMLTEVASDRPEVGKIGNQAWRWVLSRIRYVKR